LARHNGFDYNTRLLISQGTFSVLPSSRRTSAIVFISIAALYLSTLTANYYWDGITFALQIERVAIEGRTAALLFHQNHLLYNALGYLLYHGTHVIGFDIRVLPLLQIANALIGAAAVTVFFQLAQRATANRYLESEIARTYNQGGSVWLNKGAVAHVDAQWLARHASGRKIEVDASGAPALYVEVLPEGKVMQPQMNIDEHR
jgi:hypothetical protein